MFSREKYGIACEASRSQRAQGVVEMTEHKRLL